MAASSARAAAGDAGDRVPEQRGRPAAGTEFLVAAFRSGLAEANYVEGQSIAIEYRWAENQSSGSCDAK